MSLTEPSETKPDCLLKSWAFRGRDAASLGALSWRLSVLCLTKRSDSWCSERKHCGGQTADVSLQLLAAHRLMSCSQMNTYSVTFIWPDDVFILLITLTGRADDYFMLGKQLIHSISFFFIMNKHYQYMGTKNCWFFYFLADVRMICTDAVTYHWKEMTRCFWHVQF